MVGWLMVDKCLVPAAGLFDKKLCLCHLLQRLGEVFARPLVDEIAVLCQGSSGPE